MRLTLRTLLAYLDDTLEPSEIRPIGQKVAESDAAQELIARIKLVTRRRRLTTPPDGAAGQRFDPNVVADYLDNELSAEQVAEIEKICLESDVHLAEIAACHQILTLVLGEPALVPPTAKRRMYALVQGKESKATRKVVATAFVPSNDGARSTGDADDPLAGLPLFQKAPWLRWAVPVAAAVLLAVLGVYLIANLSGDNTNGQPIARNEQEEDKQPKPPNGEKPGNGKKETKETKDDETKPKETKDNGTKPDNGGTKPKETVKTPLPILKASMEQAPLGKFTSGGEVLVQRTGEKGGWERLPINGVVNSGRQLVSLPAYQSEIQLYNKVNLLLWGNVLEFLPSPLMESAVVLHKNPDFDLDFTLQRGRVYVSNRKESDPAKVRLRFLKDEVWDITLEGPNTTVAIELLSFYPPELFLKGEEPLVHVRLFVRRGQAVVKFGHSNTHNAPAQSQISWNNKEGPPIGPQPIDPREEPFWDPEPPPAKDVGLQENARNAMRIAKEELANELTKPEKKVVVALQEGLQATTPARRILAVRCLSALGAVETLLSALGNEDGRRDDVRWEAVTALRNWLGRGAEQARKLYDSKTETGLLIDRGYRRGEAESFMELIFGPPRSSWRQPVTFEALISYLKHPRLAIREMALRHLLFLAPGQEIDFNPAGDGDARQRGYEQWKKLLDEGKLPPPLPKDTTPPDGPTPGM